MLTLKQWLTRQQRVQKRLVTIQQALIGQELIAYMLYRLRFFSFNTLILTAVHLIEFYLLTIIFSFQHILSILILRSIGMVITGGWWGCLELLRSQIRHVHRRGDRPVIASVISSWLTLAATLALITAVIFIAFTCYHAHINNSPSEPLFLFYIAVVGISIAAQFITQCLHAGAYGLRRVYRPFWSISLANIIGLLCLALAWPWIDQYSLPLSFLISSLLALALTAIYTLKTYHVLGIADYCHISWQGLKELAATHPLRELLAACLSSLFMRTEGVLLLILLLGTHHHDAMEPFLIFYLIAPLISASFEWPRLFYFDLKRFNRQSFQPMLTILNRYALKTALWIGGGLWIISIIIALIYFQQLYVVCFLLLPLLVIRSYTGYQQMLRFTSNHYMDVLLCAGGVIVMALITRLLSMSLDGSIASLTMITLIGIFYLVKPRSQPIHTLDEDPQPNVYQWISEWKQLPQQPPAEVIELASIPFAAIGQVVLRKLNQVLAGHGKACQVNERTLLFYQTEKSQAIDTQWISHELAGLAHHHFILQGPLANYLYQLSKQQKHQHSTQLIEAFKREFPQGMVISFDQTKSTLATLPKPQASDIYFSMLENLSAPLQLSLNRQHIALIIYDQGIQTLLILPKASTRISHIKLWSRRVFISNISRLT